MITATKIFTFDSAHRLPNYEGPCSNLHGHTYTLYVTVAREDTDSIDKMTGMVIDFSRLKEIVKEKIVEKLDHDELNKYIELPTAENTLTWISYQLIHCTELEKLNLRIMELKLYETPTSYATWTPERR